MITVIETLDGRILITDKKNIRGVIEEARKDCVELPDKIKDILAGAEKYKSSYILISNGDIKVDRACSPISNLE
ncbi:MAG: hypothetical protein WC119_00795 [Synergistaceae bacterium]